MPFKRWPVGVENRKNTVFWLQQIIFHELYLLKQCKYEKNKSVSIYLFSLFLLQLWIVNIKRKTNYQNKYKNEVLFARQQD